MSRHEPDEDGRCRATDLLVTDCSGCRGSDESFADLVLASEPDPEEDYGVPDDTEPDYDAELRARALRPVSPDVFRLKTGRSERWSITSRPFQSRYYGSHCQLCPEVIELHQMIVKIDNGGYAHERCALEGKA